jgi:hypothetical protein
VPGEAAGPPPHSACDSSAQRGSRRGLRGVAGGLLQPFGGIPGRYCQCHQGAGLVGEFGQGAQGVGLSAAGAAGEDRQGPGERGEDRLVLLVCEPG